MLALKGLFKGLFVTPFLLLLVCSVNLVSRSNFEFAIPNRSDESDIFDEDELPKNNQRLTIGQNKKFADIIGYEKIKERLGQAVAFLKGESIKGPRTILLKSGPGWGKTTLAKAIAVEAGANLFMLNSSEELLFANSETDKVKQIFAEIKKIAKARNNGIVIVFDNFNLAIGDYFMAPIIKDLSSMNSYAIAKAKFKSSILQCMDDLENAEEKIIFVACASELQIWDKPYPREFEATVDGRVEEKFELVLSIDNFPESNIVLLLDKTIKDAKMSLNPNIDKKLVTSNLSGLSPKTIIKFINSAIQRAKSDLRTNIELSDFDFSYIEEVDKKPIATPTLKGNALFGYGTKAFSSGELEQNFSNTVIPQNLREKLDRLVEFIKNPKKFEDRGVCVPLGIILFGSAGNGKKSIARAIAGQAGAGFLEVDCSKFPGKFPDLLTMTSRLGKPVVLLLDGIDALNKDSSLGFFGPNPLKKFLEEIDLIAPGSANNLTIIATTKNLSSVASDFLKIGRFEKVLKILAPCQSEVYQLLEAFLKSKGIAIDKDVDLGRISRGAMGLSREQIYLLVNEAAILATCAQREVVSCQDFEQAQSIILKDADLIKSLKEDGSISGLSRGDEKFFQSPGIFYAPNSIETRFEDVAGCYEAKEQLKEIVDFLKNPEDYKRLGVEPPSGVLMVGEPGTGKTLLARAVAGEAGRPFISVRASEFDDMYVGVGKNRMKALFEQARQYLSIIFIDEIDAIGCRKGLDGHKNGQTITQFLAELDGFDKENHVIVIAATNRPDMVDEAIKRSGRLNKTITVELPDVSAREEILKIHSKNNKLADQTNLAQIAKETFGFNGADLKNLIKKSVLLAKKDGRSVVELKDLELARDFVYMGAENMSLIKKQDKESKRQTAYHEAGHALVCLSDPNSNPLQKVTIIPRGNALGLTWTIREEDKLKRSKAHYFAEIKVCMGGRAAEEVMYNQTFSSVTNDLENANSIARKMVKLFGMSDLGPISLSDHFDGLESQATKEKVDLEVSKILDQAYSEALSTIKQNKDKLIKLADQLIEKETLSASEVKFIVDF